MKKTPILYVEHIIKTINLIEGFVGDSTKESFLNDVKCYSAVLCHLHTMAESTQKIPQNIKNENNHLPWKDISDFSNVLVHDYLGDLNQDIIWGVVKSWLPILKETMLKIVKELDLNE
jgi:uncharacterized protein with HEPN domain